MGPTKTAHQSSLPSPIPFIFKTPDTRQQSKVKHRHETLWLLVLFALACGQTNILAISQWIRNHEALLLGRYQLLTRHNEAKLPSQATLYRFLWGVEKHIGVLENRLRQWALLLLKERAGVGISFDGKVLRGSRRSRGNEAALTLLSAYVQELGLTLHQEALKGRESRQAKRVINHLRALGAFVVTGDAAYADASLAHSVRKAGGHYLLALKHNQPELLDLAQWVFTLPQCQTDTQFDLSQVRSGEVWEWHIEARAVTAEMAHGFPGVQQFVRCTRRVFAKASGELRCEVVYALTSLPDTAEVLYGYWRGHWGIENASHHKRDTVLGEDACRTRKAAQSLAALRNLVLSLFHARGQRQVLAQVRRFNAHPHLLPIFFGWRS